MSGSLPGDFALLIAAHGERRDGADNGGVARLAAGLAGRNLAGEIGIGFIKGLPAVAETLAAFAAHRVLVYPLFLSDGYFNRVRLPQLLAKASGAHAVRVLPPLGLDPALVDIVAAKALAAVRQGGLLAAAATLVLLAHGSPSDPASRQATELMAARLAARHIFLAVRPAFLEEPPSLAQAVAVIDGPVAVVGLFAGEGLHGGADVPQLLADLRRNPIIFAGNIGAFGDLADVVAAAVRAASTDGAERVN